MSTRTVRTTTLAGPNRLAIAVATGSLVALASGGTAVLVLSGTSSVAPQTALVPPLPSSQPLAGAPGVVVLPSAPVAAGSASRRSGTRVSAVRPGGSRFVLPALLAAPPALGVLPAALPFVADPAPVAAAAPAVAEPVLELTPKQLRAAEKAARRALKDGRRDTAAPDAAVPVRLAALVRGAATAADRDVADRDDATEAPAKHVTKHANKHGDKHARKHVKKHVSKHAKKHQGPHAGAHRGHR